MPSFPFQCLHWPISLYFTENPGYFLGIWPGRCYAVFCRKRDAKEEKQNKTIIEMMAEENHVKTDFKSYNSQTIQNLVYWLLYESSEFCLPKISFQPTKLIIHTFRKAFLLKKCHSGKNLQNQARKQEQSIILKHNGHPNCLHMDYARFFQQMYVRNALVMTSFYDKCGSTEKKDSDLAIRDAFVHTVCFPFSWNATFAEENSCI